MSDLGQPAAWRSQAGQDVPSREQASLIVRTGRFQRGPLTSGSGAACNIGCGEPGSTSGTQVGDPDQRTACAARLLLDVGGFTALGSLLHVLVATAVDTTHLCEAIWLPVLVFGDEDSAVYVIGDGLLYFRHVGEY